MNAVLVQAGSMLGAGMDKAIAAVNADNSAKANLTFLRHAIEGDAEKEAFLLSDTRQFLPGVPVTRGMANAEIIKRARPVIAKLQGQRAAGHITEGMYNASAEMAISGIIILVALFVGILIMTQVKSTAVDVAGNDTDAVDLLNTVYTTGKAGLVIFALSVLVLGAVVILSYLKTMQKQ